jgi:hypothetical protein
VVCRIPLAIVRPIYRRRWSGDAEEGELPLQDRLQTLGLTNVSVRARPLEAASTKGLARNVRRSDSAR